MSPSAWQIYNLRFAEPAGLLTSVAILAGLFTFGRFANLQDKSGDKLPKQLLIGITIYQFDKLNSAVLAFKNYAVVAVMQE